MYLKKCKRYNQWHSTLIQWYPVENYHILNLCKYLLKIALIKDTPFIPPALLSILKCKHLQTHCMQNNCNQHMFPYQQFPCTILWHVKSLDANISILIRFFIHQTCHSTFINVVLPNNEIYLTLRIFCHIKHV